MMGNPKETRDSSFERTMIRLGGSVEIPDED
jgi:hypothetical protein